MQSIAEIEAICERNTLAQAEAYMNAQDEAYMNAQDEEPSARECFDNCVHSRACRRMFEHYAYSPETDEAVDLMVMEIGCAEECQEYKDAWCPMPWSGTMRCQGPKKVER